MTESIERPLVTTLRDRLTVPVLSHPGFVRMPVDIAETARHLLAARDA